MSAGDWSPSPTSRSFPNHDQQSELDDHHLEGVHLSTNHCKNGCCWSKMQSCHENVHLVAVDDGDTLAESLVIVVCIDLDEDWEGGVHIQLEGWETVDLVCNESDIHLEKSVNHDPGSLGCIVSCVGLVIEVVGLVDDDQSNQSVHDDVHSLKCM